MRVILTLFFLLVLKGVFAQEIACYLETSNSPISGTYGIKGVIRIQEDGLTFIPKRKAQYINKVSISYSMVQNYYKKNPLGFPNRLVIETNINRYQIYTYKRNVLINALHSRLDNKEIINDSIQIQATIRLTQFPLLAQFDINGRLTLGGDTLAFIPYNDFGTLARDIKIDINRIQKVRKSNYFLFRPNGITIRTQSGEKYKFAVWNRNQVYTTLKKRL